MKYCRAFNIWEIPAQMIPKIQPGQWVYAGKRDTMGRFLGVKPSGSVVVGWKGNAAGHKSRRAYYRALRDYALGG